MLAASALSWPLGLTLVPALVLAAAASLVRCDRPAAQAWRIARAATVAVLATSVAALIGRVAGGAEAGALVRLDATTVVVLALVAVVGWVVVRFSATYLRGDPSEQRYARLMLATLAAVTVVVVANHLVLLVVAWTLASVALHGLLTHFGDRSVAVAVAHKKFLLARCADACMVGAVVGFWTTFDTLRIDEITAAATAGGALPGGARVAIALVAMAALLKCAQLPFHGWLIQVMEAPTPVSALLHAGVVNLGGFVLLRFAPVVDRAVETRTLLVVVGIATAVVASLVMTTRVSVKVALAWSTCAQMGFMLVQCGLGLWEMALLHLTAHSLYKADAFLSAGGTVRRTQRRQLAAAAAPPTWRALATGTCLALVSTASIALGWQALPGTTSLTPAVWLLLGVVALALVPLLTPERRLTATSAAAALAVPTAYLALHEAFGRMVAKGAAAPAALLVVVGVAVAGLFALQAACRTRPDSPLVRRMRPWLYAGLFLDERFTRAAFAVSPPAAPRERPALLPRPLATAVVRTSTSPAAPTPTPVAHVDPSTPIPVMAAASATASTRTVAS